jgi:hypothetical protein
VSAASKDAFQQTLLAENHGDFTHEYIWIYIPADRLVFINKKDITRITFCYEPVPGTTPKYFDNFSRVDEPEKELFDSHVIDDIDIDEDSIAQLIVKHHRQKETTQIVKGVTVSKEAYFDNISYYSSLGEGDVNGFEFNYSDDMDEFELIVGQYLQFIDDDGEENFMPLSNLSVIEIQRPLIMNDEMLKRYLENEY